MAKKKRKKKAKRTRKARKSNATPAALKRLPLTSAKPTVKVSATPLTLFLSDVRRGEAASRVARKQAGFEVVWKAIGTGTHRKYQAHLVRPVARTSLMVDRVTYYMRGVIDGMRG